MRLHFLLYLSHQNFFIIIALVFLLTIEQNITNLGIIDKYDKMVSKEIKETIDGQLLSNSSEAIDLIAKSTAKASAIAAVPIPLLDMGGVIFIQMDMVKKLAVLYDIDTENQQKVLFSTVLSTLSGALISESLSSITEATHLENILSESLIKGTVAGLLTTITGEVYKEHFENGGTLVDVNIESYRGYIKNQLNSDRIATEVLGSKAIDTVLNKFRL